MQAQNLFLYDRAHGEPLEDPIELVPTGVRVLWFLLQAPTALVTEPVDRVDRGILVVPADQVDLSWISDLESEEQTHCLERELPAIHKIAEEQIIHRIDVAVVPISRSLIPCEEAHQVKELPMDVAIHLDGSSQLEHHVLALQDLEDLIAELCHLHGVEQEPVLVRVGLPRRRLEEVLYYEGGHPGRRPLRGDVRHHILGLDLAAFVLQRLYADLFDDVREILLQAHEHLR
mmetsp:Transcript_114840/g.325269  ORF Transcript_114840/g.325269 Transcript_114840/m.325269 type:complete len:231 (-) Transcript_114840:523-1215(-)